MPIKSNFKQFKKAWKRRIETDLPNAKEALLREFVITIFSSIVMESAWDTGRYRGAHELTVGRPVYDSILSSDETKAFPIFDPEQTINRAKTNLVLDARHLDGVSIFIQNPLAYAWPLETGHSTQMPKGNYSIAYQRSIILWRKIIQMQRLENK